MNVFQAALLVTALACGPSCLVAAPHTVGQRPNVLLIVADDLGFSDLGAYGGEIQTPNLDRLAREGLRCTQFYNNAVCNVTRGSLLTGLYPRGAVQKVQANMATLGEVMKAAGYATCLTGKWHLGSVAPFRPIDGGFDEFYGILTGACNYFDPTVNDPAFYGGGKRPFFHNEDQISEVPPDFYTTDAFSDHAIKMIRDYAGAGRPFFINLNYTAPHFPLQARPEDIARYRGKYRKGYLSLREDRFQRQVALKLIDPKTWRLAPLDAKTGDYRYDYDVPAWDSLDEPTRRREQERMEVYAAMVDRMDQGIGRVLAALEAAGVAKNTLVMFLSDNGGCASQPLPEDMAGYVAYNRDVPVGDRNGYELVGPGWGWAQNAPFRRYKTWTYEGGICTPMIVRWPEVTQPGTIITAVGHVVDLMPTLIELVGGSYPKERAGTPILPLEGKSLLPVWRGSLASRDTPVFWELYGNRAIRDGDWKLVWGASDRRWELYNLEQDRTESKNVAHEHPDRVAAMAEQWVTWRKGTEATSTEHDLRGVNH